MPFRQRQRIQNIIATTFVRTAGHNNTMIDNDGENGGGSVAVATSAVSVVADRTTEGAADPGVADVPQQQEQRQEQQQEQQPIEYLRVWEFFSGIGGMRCALDRALASMAPPTSKVTTRTTTTTTRRRKRMELMSCNAYEIHRDANRVYQRNFVKIDKKYDKDNIQHNNNKCSSSFRVHTKLVEQLALQDIANIIRTTTGTTTTGTTTTGPCYYYDLWTLSPPCQPFTNTRFAKQRDLDDKRNKGLLSLLQLLEQLVATGQGTETTTDADDAAADDGDNGVKPVSPPPPPKWIFLENVQGFVQSQVRQVLLETLSRCKYSWQEYLLSPIQLGIPNHRKRYYILCEASDRFFFRRRQPTINLTWLDHHPTPPPTTKTTTTTTTTSDNKPICTEFPHLLRMGSVPNSTADFVNHRNNKQQQTNNATTTTTTIAAYLDKEADVDWTLYGLDHSILSQPWARDIPLVGPQDTQSHCFTAFYSRQIHKSTGSLLLQHNDILSVASDATAAWPLLDRSQMTRYVGKIRKLTPTELLRLFGFPSTWLDDEEEEKEEEAEDENGKNDKVKSNGSVGGDKDNLRLQTKYKLIGNSINVTVVSILLEFLLGLGDDDDDGHVESG